jgi:hypothetical protein
LKIKYKGTVRKITENFFENIFQISLQTRKFSSFSSLLPLLLSSLSSLSSLSFLFLLPFLSLLPASLISSV